MQFIPAVFVIQIPHYHQLGESCGVAAVDRRRSGTISSLVLRCLEVVSLLLRLGVDPSILGRGDHTPLYCVANECASETGPEVVRALVRAGADVDACGGVTRATALHMAARRGHVEIARALLDSGAAVNARDRKGDTPYERAINCRMKGVSQLLLERGPVGTVRPTSHSRPRG